MKTSRLLSLASLLLGLIVPTVLLASPLNQQKPTVQKQLSFDNLAIPLRSFLQDQSIPGLSLVIVRDNQIVYKESFGWYHPDTILPIGSAANVASVTAIMTLVDQGKLHLDDPVNKYITDWPVDKEQITVRQLLSHTSGIQAPPSPCYANSRLSVANCEQEIAKMPLQAEPGKGFIDSPNDFEVAARIAEIISGKNWNDFFDAAIGTPCGLSHFTYQNRLATRMNPWIAGTAETDLDDYAKILMIHLSNGSCGSTRILSDSSVLEMQKDNIGSVTIIQSPFNNYVTHYGLGWWIDTMYGYEVSEVVDPGMYGSIVWIDKRHNYAGFLMTEGGFAKSLYIWDQIRPLIARDIPY